VTKVTKRQFGVFRPEDSFAEDSFTAMLLKDHPIVLKTLFPEQGGGSGKAKYPAYARYLLKKVSLYGGDKRLRSKT